MTVHKAPLCSIKWYWALNENTSGCSVKVWPYIHIFFFWLDAKSQSTIVCSYSVYASFFLNLSSIHSQNHLLTWCSWAHAWCYKKQVVLCCLWRTFLSDLFGQNLNIFFSFRQFSVAHTTWWTSTQSLKFYFYLCQNHIDETLEWTL